MSADLAILNILGPSLCDLHFSFQPFRVGHARKVGARRHPLPNLNGYDLQHAIKTCPNMESIHLVALQLVESPQLFHLCLLHRQLAPGWTQH